MSEVKPTLTKGQQVMSVAFNPGQREDVKKIKQDCADMYDFLNDEQKRKYQEVQKDIDTYYQEQNAKLEAEGKDREEKGEPHPVNTVIPPIPAELQAKIDNRNESYRLTCEAQKHLETFQMYAVKAVTR